MTRGDTLGAPGLVTVVIPTFNAATFIEETLASVAAQRYPAIEVVVADNGSTDDTVARVRASGIVDRILTVSARGPSAARNACLDAARGEMLQFLDAYDLLEPDKITRQVDVLAESGASVVWAPFWRYERDAAGTFRPSQRVEPAIGADVTASLLRPDGFLQLGALLLRRTGPIAFARFEQVRRVVEDVRYLLELALAGADFVRSPGDSGLLFRQHDGPRASKADAVEFALSCVDNARRCETVWRERAELSEDRIAVLTEVYLFALRTLHGRNREAFAGVLAHLSALNPRYRDRLPARLRVAARLLGYPAAESVASAYRALTSSLRRLPEAGGQRA
jgi:glycosyltransferase involved in cell wall biosynthesis